ncbi:MAG: hypothetical protein SFU86_16535 [Pirellulaceae bacterium]|nr:hypothetical protein [Pirellulaceae bacterium]
MKTIYRPLLIAMIVGIVCLVVGLVFRDQFQRAIGPIDFFHPTSGQIIVVSILAIWSVVWIIAYWWLSRPP